MTSRRHHVCPVEFDDVFLRRLLALVDGRLPDVNLLKGLLEAGLQAAERAREAGLSLPKAATVSGMPRVRVTVPDPLRDRVRSMLGDSIAYDSRFWEEWVLVEGTKMVLDENEASEAMLQAELEAVRAALGALSLAPDGAGDC